MNYLVTHLLNAGISDEGDVEVSQLRFGLNVVKGQR